MAGEHLIPDADVNDPTTGILKTILEAILSGTPVELGAKELEDGTYALQVYAAGLEVNAEEINLNTDGLEGLLGDIKTLLTELGSPTDPVNVEALLKDSTGNEIDLSNLEIILPTPLKADRIPSITTDGGNVAQTGILAADLYNSGNTTITVWFGEAPGAGKSIYLNSGQRWTGYIDDQSGMYYDSDAAGGQLDYVLRG